jgi:hypothetical protein
LEEDGILAGLWHQDTTINIKTLQAIVLGLGRL